MTKERIRSRENLTPAEAYYFDPRVMGAMLGFLGSEARDWNSASHCAHAFIGVATRRKALDPNKTSPSRTYPLSEIGDAIRDHKGEVELHGSLLPSPSEVDPKMPVRGLFIIDVDRYRMIPDGRGGHDYDERSTTITPEETFSVAEPIVEIYVDLFKSMNLPVIATMTTKGVHFLSQITDPNTLDIIRQIGGPLEPSIAWKLRQAADLSYIKRQEPIPESFQQIHVGLGRLQQFVNSLVIREARRQIDPSYKVEIFNVAQPGQLTDGFGLDNIQIAYPVFHKNISLVGNVACVKGYIAGAREERYPIQLPFANQGFNHDWRELIPYIYSYQQAARYLGGVDCSVPDAGGIETLIDFYMQSDLRRLHESMDKSFGDDSSTYDSGYRRDGYMGVLKQARDSEVNKNTVDHAPSFFGPGGLQFYYLNKLIFDVFEAMGSRLDRAPHVAGFLNAVLTDTNKPWGRYWNKMDAAVFARKVTEQVLGQLFERE